MRKRMIVEKIRTWKLNRSLKRRISHQGLNPAENIAVLYYLKDDRGLEFEAVDKYCRQLASKGKRIIHLGYFPGKRKRFEEKFKNIGEGVITRSEFDWLGLPKKDKIEKVLGSDIDILFNFDTSKSLVLHLIAASSAARFKVGIDTGREAVYDLLIDVKPEFSIGKIIEQTKKVLGEVFPKNLNLI